MAYTGYCGLLLQGNARLASVLDYVNGEGKSYR